ncbi:hypothetical protein GCM10011571_03700 [Marinithermofilum abyssi]|uniref:Uncharacterized protein n=1 Tax=Marinithermofilum abyssi TaxID=1571185 RepID=A0A8J2VD67_9BACL|nr:hypothetical protein [Marinithermofilum abyssi]GGE05842.1 hypothetical protein GCM10011571_03700 [Marinithermofilum abyssi]
MKPPKRVSANRIEPLTQVNWGAQIADMKEAVYQNGVFTAALMEVMERKGLLQQQEVMETMRRLDAELLTELEWEVEKRKEG